MDTAHSLPMNAPNTNLGYKTIEERKSPELVFAFVEPIGGGANQVEESLSRILQKPRYEYAINPIQMSKILEEEAKIAGIKEPQIHSELEAFSNLLSPEAKRISRLQKLGNELREKKGYDFLAKKAVQRIADYRSKNAGYQQAEGAVAPVPKPLRVAHIIRSIKHEDELKLLKAVYGGLFILIGVSGDYEKQVFNFRPKVDSTDENKQIEEEYKAVSKVDQYEGIDNGQRVRKVFYQADFFLKNDENQYEKALTDFLDLLFGIKLKTPSWDERMMFEAFAASLRSVCLSRQVGAAISDSNNELISTGYNDIPSVDGGLATDDKKYKSNALCKSKGGCRSSIEINKLLLRLHDELKNNKLLLQKAKKTAVLSVLEKAGIAELIEFSRAIHAEMEAILSAARTGKLGLRGGTLYVTTYPCENCAKHIIAVGINRVVYIEPYPKSRAKAFFPDFITDVGQEAVGENTVTFSQFEGVSPQAYSRLYKMSFDRKQDSGKIFQSPVKPMPITDVFLDGYTLYEGKIATEVDND